MVKSADYSQIDNAPESEFFFFREEELAELERLEFLREQGFNVEFKRKGHGVDISKGPKVPEDVAIEMREAGFRGRRR